MSEDHKRNEGDENYRPRLSRDAEKYEENQPEGGEDRDRQEYRCTAYAGMQSPDKDAERMALCCELNSGLARQIRIPVRKGREGNDITPDIKTFLEKGSRRRPKTVQD